MNADVIDRAFPPLPDRLSKDDWQDVADVLDAAAEWSAGRLPLESFAAVGTMLSPFTGRPSAQYTRYVAARVTIADKARLAPLLRALDHLLLFQGQTITSHGVFDRDELVNVTVLGSYRRDAA